MPTDTSTHPNDPTNRPHDMPTTAFGPYLIPLAHTFYTSKSRLCLAFVNLKPLLPGHVLVIPQRVVPRYSNLTVPETTDLALTVRKVSRVVERVYGADALNIAMQDGEAAGQSVPHVHFHVIPRRKGDYDRRGGNDMIYEELEDGALGKRLKEREGGRNGERKGPGGLDEEERRARGDEEMESEATMLRAEMEREEAEEGGA